MKKILATAAVLLTPVSAMAADGNRTDGFGSLSLGYNVFDTGTFTSWDSEGYLDEGPYEGGKADGLDLEARVSVAVPVSGNFAAQVDAVMTRTGYKESNSGYPNLKVNENSIAAHVFWRDPAKGLVGLVGQRTAATSNIGYIYNPTTYYIGGEGQLYSGKFTAYGQVVYGSSDNFEDGRDGVNAALQLRYFPQDDLMLALKGGYEDMTARNKIGYDWRAKDKTWLLGAKGEYRLSASRVSVLLDADYRNTTSRYSEDNGYHERSKYHDYRAMVGVKVNFGASSLFERDRSGASLDPVRPLFSGWTGDEYMEAP